MILESIAASGFRNLNGRLTWGRGLNIIYGDNGQGKTSWLEAIYLLATTKSFRTTRLQEAVRFNQDKATVQGVVNRGADTHRELEVRLFGPTKSNHVNGKREAVSRYLSQLHVVAFTADDLAVVRGGPNSRRRFIDRGVVTLFESYVQTLADYNKVIRQKNKILQTSISQSLSLDRANELVDPWNEQLVRLGAQIHRARVDYVHRLNGALERRLFDQDDISLRYVSSVADVDPNDYETLMADTLNARLRSEMAAGFSLVGPHRDELEILLNSREIATYGSSGQQRSALITLDLAVISLYYSWHNEYPLFLIDDVDAELDGKRVKCLLDYLDGRAQTFITTSTEGLVMEFEARAAVFHVFNGQVAGEGEEQQSQGTSPSAEVAVSN